MKRLVTLISNKGTGTNLQAIADGVGSGKINAKIVAVVSDTKESLGLKRAKKHKLPIKICPKKEDLLALLKKLNPNYICLAGWKQIILDEVIDAFPNRILNLHPGLIPDDNHPDGTLGLWNRGLLADKAIQNFLDKKALNVGSSIHFLTKEFDFGPVLGRCFEKIKKEDTVDSLYTRLKVKENKLYVDVLAKLCKENDLNILVIGSNGREHALAVCYARSKKVKKVIMTPGNGLTDFKNPKIKNYPEVAMMNFEGIVKVCQKEKIDLVDVAQDDIIAAGFADKFNKLGISAFGPTQKASQIEWDKQWARNFMVKYKLPVPEFKAFNNKKEAIKYIDELYDRYPERSEGSRDSSSRLRRTQNDNRVVYVKVSGLAAGKGAIRAENREQAIVAIESMSQFGKSGETFLIEEAMVGEEFSLFAFCDGKDYKIVSWAQDHKTVLDGDRGPNTGGMGCVAPTGVLNTSILRIIEVKILKPFVEGMQKEGRPYRGVIYFGGMLTHSTGSGQGVKIIEFNARWGDPEAEVILPAVKTDYLDIVEAVIYGKLKKLKVNFDKKLRISVAGCSRGYPDDYSNVADKEIFGLTEAMKIPGIIIFGAGIKRKGERFFANGGRIFHLVAEGKDILEAREKVYSAMKLISIEGNNLHYRTDIGWRDMTRLRETLRRGKKRL